MARNPSKPTAQRAASTPLAQRAASRPLAQRAKADPQSSNHSSGDTVLCDDEDGDSTMTNGAPDQHTPQSDTDTATYGQFNIASSSNAALEFLSRDSNKLMDAINKLALLGLQKDNVELPKIVTIGDQSAGKSSVIAAISGITVPRKDSTCTRCPTHVNLRKATSDEWSCTISLEKNHHFIDGRWTELPSKDSYLTQLAKVTSPENLESILERAQIAQLNPDINPKHIIHAQDKDLPRPRFRIPMSPNLVHLDITGPACPNLTFYDLPGVLNQTETDDEVVMVEETRRLARAYIEPENNIILLACAMGNDLENSSAAGLVKDARHRTIGLLTKADLLPVGSSLDKWSRLLNGETFGLGHDYFVTKQPNQLQLNQGIDHNEARHQEEHFFRSHEPWRTQLSKFRHRFGIPKLQEKLSKLLVDHIKQTLPILRAQVDASLIATNEALKELPEPPGNQCFSIVSKIVHDLGSLVASHMKGELPHNDFVNQWLAGCQEFGRDLHALRPTLVYRTPSEIEERNRLKASVQPIEIDGDNDDNPPPSARKRQGSSFMAPSPAKRTRPNGTSFETATSTSSQSTSEDVKPTDADLYTYSPPLDPPSPVLHLEQVRSIRRSMNTSAVAGTSDHRADEHLILQSVQRWDEPVQRFVRASASNLQKLIVQELCSKLLSPWKTTLLHSKLPELIGQFITDAMAKHSEMAMHLLRSEQLQPTTFNIFALKAAQQQETKVFADARRKWRTSLFLDRDEQKKGRFTENEEREAKMQKVTEQHLGEDEFIGEIEAMGKIRGYYNVASSNLVDTIAKLQRYDLFEHTRVNLISEVEKSLKLHTAEGFEYCKELLAESPDRAEKRARLLTDQQRFKEAKASLDKLFEQQ